MNLTKAYRPRTFFSHLVVVTLCRYLRSFLELSHFNRDVTFLIEMSHSYVKVAHSYIELSSSYIRMLIKFATNHVSFTQTKHIFIDRIFKVNHT